MDFFPIPPAPLMRGHTMNRTNRHLSDTTDFSSLLSLPEDDVRAVLRTADAVSGTGGKQLLLACLKGTDTDAASGSVPVPCPGFGYYTDLKPETVEAIVDFLLRTGYLETDADRQDARIRLTPSGWKIERETLSRELYCQLVQDAQSMSQTLTKYSPEIRLLVLDRIEQEQNRELLPLLENWKDEGDETVRRRLSEVAQQLRAQASQGRRLCVLFPGLGYTCDKPLLYYSAKLAQCYGYEIRHLSYSDMPGNAKKDPSALALALSRATSQSFAALDAIDWSKYDQVLLISKSIGTQIACSYLAARCLPAASILLTPLESTFRYKVHADLAFHGTCDPWAPDSAAIRNACERDGIRLIEIEGANHSLETGDVELDVRNLETVLHKIRVLLERLSPEHPEA